MHKSLETISKNLRIDILEMIYKAGSGHPGGSLSMIDILTYLYFEKMNLDLNKKDKFVLSKGHAAPALYAVLAEKGYIKKEELGKLRKFGSILQGHPDSKKCNGVEISTGSLGQGLSNATGMALGFKMDNLNNKVYVIVGDGEIQEGIVWESFMASAKLKLENLVVIIDNNKLQLDGKVEDIMPIYNLENALESFGFEVSKCDGHNFDEIKKAFDITENKNGKPKVIIADTIKGKGVSFMENEVVWHGGSPSKEELEKAKSEIL